jgi:RNA ligase
LTGYINNNLITANKHPIHDIWILNYSPKAHGGKLWDLYTMSSRGLVIDVDGEILARPFQKFKNIEEHDPSEIDMSLDFEIFDKVDGSLIVYFYYHAIEEWIVASRGSFISEQSVEARKMLGRIDLGNYMHPNFTYLFEILYVENRIVVNYGDREELVMLGVINTSNGDELSHTEMFMGHSRRFAIVKKFNIKNVKNLLELKELEEDNREGFVVRFSNGFRVKVKFSEYVRLHGILTNVSNLTIWEHLRNNYDFDQLLDRVPDEFYDWLKATTKVLTDNYNDIERLALKEFFKIYYINEVTTRKDFAHEAVKTEYRSVLFKLYDRRPYGQLIWNMIRPEFSKPFDNSYFRNQTAINVDKRD